MTTEDHLLSALREPVAVVGNGALGRVGGAIDSHATVIRINRFATAGHEEFCGTRTTHWCVRFHVPLRDMPRDLCPFTPYCRNESREWNRRTDILFARERLAVRLGQRAPDIQSRCFGSTLDRHEETTGFALTVLLLDLGFRPTLFGFDGLRTGHYLAPGHRHWPGHVHCVLELEYLRSWGLLHETGEVQADASPESSGDRT